MGFIDDQNSVSDYVKLPWNEEKIKSILSNYAVELNALNRVVKKLERDNLYEKYAKVIHQQEKKGWITEQINIAPDRFKDCLDTSLSSY